MVKPSTLNARENETTPKMLETNTNATEEETSNEYDDDYDNDMSPNNTTHMSWRVEVHHVASFVKVGITKRSF